MTDYQPSPDGTCSRECEQWRSRSSPVEFFCKVDNKWHCSDYDICPIAYRAMRDVAKEIDGIVAESRGVDGFHLNGDVAEWGEFDLPTLLDAVPRPLLEE